MSQYLFWGYCLGFQYQTDFGFGVSVSDRFWTARVRDRTLDFGVLMAPTWSFAFGIFVARPHVSDILTMDTHKRSAPAPAVSL